MQAPKQKEYNKMTPGYTWYSFLDEDRLMVSNELNLEMNGIFEISTQSWRQSRGWESRSFHSLHTDERVAVGRKKFSWYTLLIVDKKTNKVEEMSIDYNAYMQAFETVRWEVDHLPQSSFQCLDYPYFAEFDVNAPVVVLYQLEQKKQKAIVLEMEPMFGGQGQRYQILPGAIQAEKERIFITTIALNDGEVSLFNRNTLLVFDFKGQLVQKIESKYKLGLSTTYKGEVYFYGIDPIEYGPIKLLKLDN